MPAGLSGDHIGRRVFSPLVLALSLASAACDSDSPFPSPSPNTGVAQSIAITGTTTLERPGMLGQLTATVAYADGSTRDVSLLANWTVDRNDIVSISQGRIVSKAYGQCTVIVAYGSVAGQVQVRVVPSGMFLLSGRVTDEGGLPLGGATVGLTGMATDMSVSTGAQGGYVLPAVGDVEAQVAMDGFDAVSERLNVSGDMTRDFQMKLTPSVEFTGTYHLTLTAAGSCALPAEAMLRRYIVRLSEDSAGELTVVVVAPPDMVAWGEAGFTGTRQGSQVQFVVTDDFQADYQFREALGSGSELTLVGTATGEIGNGFHATFSGSVIVRQAEGIVTECQAPDHSLDFVR